LRTLRGEQVLEQRLRFLAACVSETGCLRLAHRQARHSIPRDGYDGVHGCADAVGEPAVTPASCAM
jgi:hypothetical protein